MQIVLYTPSLVRYNPCHGIILLTKLGTSGSQKIERCTRNAGEFFREAAVLVLIFYPLEMARNGTLPLPFIFLVGIGCIALLLMALF